jgi:5-methylcytosine-specific restriction enzyme B
MQEIYLSTNTVKNAYKILIKIKVKNASIMHIFLILKGCGYNRGAFLPVEKLSSDEGFEKFREISSLFSKFEKTPEKYDFINPFSMRDWAGNPTENMKKWMPGRVKNNIIGGATTWRPILNQDVKSGDIKFHYDYLSELKKITLDNNKINLIAAAIWANRFTKFGKKFTKIELYKHFIKAYNLTNEEVGQLFESGSEIDLEFSEKMHNTEEIRSLIGIPNEESDWIKSIIDTERNEFTLAKENSVVLNMESDISIEKLKKIIESDFQVLLIGPPGTSKSYKCRELSRNYDSVRKIQFHPQYTYQQFVGGYVVEKDQVVFRKGVLLDLLEDIKNNDDSKKYLLIIDEINRANISQVLGEVIQCLDRDNEVNVFDGKEWNAVNLPKNLHIIATMNSSDKTIGSLDHAVRRRFLNVYCPPNKDTLIELCPSKNFISLGDLMEKINSKLYENLKNRELKIGHTFFISDNVKNEDGKYIWNFETFETVFNYKILPMIEEFCYGDSAQIVNILGEKLSNQLRGKEFEDALKEYLEDKEFEDALN